ncbi:MAG TPA: adenylate/guanylate cyclase domain-containing protein [Acidimicrobiales bacterium]|nr:adenylate/guanylate cyclase domain-containing protein [Acidimicrobiales bacterium]
MSDLELWRQAGLYDPDDPSADERLALLRYLSDRGASIDQMVEAHAQGNLPAVASDLVVRKNKVVRASEVAAQSGIALDRVLRVLLAAGIPAEPDTEVPAKAIDLMAAFEQGSALMGDEAILAFTRLLGAAAIQIAEAAVALFYSELGPGTEREGRDELTRAQLAETATMAFTSVPSVLAQMVFDQFERALRRAVAVRGWGQENATSPTGVVDARFSGANAELVALGFVDLVGSTAWAQGLSLRDQSLALARFESAAWSSAVLSGGRVVKMIGDEVFFAAPTAEVACRIGIDIIRAAAEDEVLPTARGVVGVGYATPREGDYFGPLVNVLSRMVKVGQPGELVVTDAAAAQLSTNDWKLRSLGLRELRGVPRPVKAFVVEPV